MGTFENFGRGAEQGLRVAAGAYRGRLQGEIDQTNLDLAVKNQKLKERAAKDKSTLDNLNARNQFLKNLADELDIKKKEQTETRDLTARQQFSQNAPLYSTGTDEDRARIAGNVSPETGKLLSGSRTQRLANRRTSAGTASTEATTKSVGKDIEKKNLEIRRLTGEVEAEESGEFYKKTVKTKIAKLEAEVKGLEEKSRESKAEADFAEKEFEQFDQQSADILTAELSKLSAEQEFKRGDPRIHELAMKFTEGRDDVEAVKLTADGVYYDTIIRAKGAGAGKEKQREKSKISGYLDAIKQKQGAQGGI